MINLSNKIREILEKEGGITGAVQDKTLNALKGVLMQFIIIPKKPADDLDASMSAYERAENFIDENDPYDKNPTAYYGEYERHCRKECESPLPKLLFGKLIRSRGYDSQVVRSSKANKTMRVWR